MYVHPNRFCRWRARAVTPATRADCAAARFPFGNSSLLRTLEGEGRGFGPVRASGCVLTARGSPQIDVVRLWRPFIPSGCNDDVGESYGRRRQGDSCGDSAGGGDGGGEVGKGSGDHSRDQQRERRLAQRVMPLGGADDDGGRGDPGGTNPGPLTSKEAADIAHGTEAAAAGEEEEEKKAEGTELKVNLQNSKQETEEKKKDERKARKPRKADEERPSRQDKSAPQETSHEALAPSSKAPAAGSGSGSSGGDSGGGDSGGGEATTGNSGDAAGESDVGVGGAEGKPRGDIKSGGEGAGSFAKAAPGSSRGGGGGGGASGTGSPQRSTTAPKDPATPSALDKVLEQLGLLPQSRLTGEAAAAAELEAKYRAVALAARADAQTLPLRLERQARLRDQAERNVANEADELARALHRLNYLCKEAESAELLGAARDQIGFVLRAAKYVAATAETMGALRLEARMSGWMEASLRYNDQLKLQLETARAEHEEMRRVLTESGASIETSSSPSAGVRRNALSVKLGSQRRASIAAPPRPAASTSTSNTKDQGRLSLAFVPGAPAISPPILRLGTGRRPLSSASSDITVGGTGTESSTPSPPVVPDDFPPRMDDAVAPPLEENVVDPVNPEESLPRNSLPRLSGAGLADPEVEELSVPHERRRKSAVTTSVTMMTVPPSHITARSARSLYPSTALSDVLEYIWPPDMFACAQHARWLLVRLLILAAIWCLVQAFMSPADAYEQYSSNLPDLGNEAVHFIERPD